LPKLPQLKLPRLPSKKHTVSEKQLEQYITILQALRDTIVELYHDKQITMKARDKLLSLIPELPDEKTV